MSKRRESAEKIRQLNDRFRTSVPDNVDIPGRVMLTSGIQNLVGTDAEPGKHLPNLFEAIRSFDDFTSENDPYGEHDFGSFDFENACVFWKFDYYAPDLVQGANDPTDIGNTTRVLTIMLAEEY